MTAQHLPPPPPTQLLTAGANCGGAAGSMVRNGAAGDVVVAVDSLGARFRFTRPGRLKRLRVTRQATPGAGTSVVYTIRVNGANTAVTCTLGNGPTEADDLVNAVAVAAGDYGEVTVAVGSGAPGNSPTVASFDFEG